MNRRVNHLEPVDRDAPVSVVMTVRNEEPHLERAVASVLGNGFAPGVELVIAVGPSEDATARVADELARRHGITVVENSAGGTPQGLNLALALSEHDVVVRVDGHGELPPGYIAQAVDTLAETGAANVGGRMVPEADEPFARAVAVAMKSAWGIGGAGHRVGGTAGPAESVFLGAFRRAALDQVGGYDEHFARAQDWELNYRLREAGYTVWFEPRMEVAYRPRRSWRELARQFYHSGRWRREVTRVHRLGASPRYFAPPAVLTAVVLGSGLGMAGLVLDHGWLTLGFAAPILYVAGVFGASAMLVPKAGAKAALRLPAVLMTMHMAWGAGFLRGVR